jgi:hypothetical protein
MFSSMTWSGRDTQKRGLHERIIRSVVDFANEVRLSMRNTEVIFGTVVSVPKGEAGSFHVRPWGLVASKAFHFDDVAVAVPVKRMGWARHRAITAAQRAGIFAGHKPGGQPRTDCD